ncbi:hypothetical protein [Citrobacter amalonaticus]|uniref:YybH family protein n=1 Tax=Citrobacter amalonaticus TaxID=35703 RepID=UPI00300C10CB
MKKIVLLLLTFTSLNVFASSSDEAIHRELRQAMVLVESAINSGEYDKMLPVLSNDLRATPITQEFIHGKEEIAPYFGKWFGKDKFLKSLNISLSADTQTELSTDRTWGVVYGKGREKYSLNDGRSYDIPTRWTATVVLEEGHWKIRTIHFGANFVDNPLINEATQAINKVMYGAGVGGLLVGLILGFFLFRRKGKR